MLQKYYFTVQYITLSCSLGVQDKDKNMLNGIILLFIIMKQEEIYADDYQGFRQMIILDYDFQSQIDSKDAGELRIVHQLAVINAIKNKPKMAYSHHLEIASWKWMVEIDGGDRSRRWIKEICPVLQYPRLSFTTHPRLSGTILDYTSGLSWTWQEVNI